MPGQKVRFANREAALFIEEVKTRTSEYFEREGISSKANGKMVLKTVILLGLTFVPYFLILSNRFAPWQMLVLAVIMGIGMAGVGFSIAHDALHGAYSSNARVNKILGYLFDLLGANGYMWKITHNVIHHTYTNIPGLDEDLDVTPLVRLSPGSPWRPVHRYQHLFGFFTYGLATLNWLFIKDFRSFLMKDIGPYKNKVHPRKEIFHLIWTKLLVYAYMIVIPLLVLDVAWWQFLIGFLAAHVTAGIILGVIFQLAHVVEGPEYPLPDEKGLMEHTWIIHEMITTANFARKNRLLSWYIGGLNYQIEHHLFPQVCSIHYPEVSKIVREVAAKYDVPYNYHPTLFAAMRSHYRMLKQLGQPRHALQPALAH